MGKGDRSDSYVNPCIKYLLFFFNFIFWLIGCALIGIGSWAFVEKNRFKFNGSEDNDINIYDLVFDLTIIMIILGAIIFILAFTGCVGALRENVCLLKFFAYTLGILFIIQIILAILAFVFSSEVKAKLAELLEEEGIIRYQGNDPDLTNLIDWFQETFMCCGVGLNGFKDWDLNMYFNCNSSNPSHWRCSVPYSCCVNPNDIQADLVNTLCGYQVQSLSYPEASQVIYVRGCVDAILQLAEDKLYIIGGVAIGLAVPQLIGIFLAKILYQQVEDQRELWI